MVDERFKNVIDRIFTHDPTLHKLVQSLKEEPTEEEKEKDDEDNKDKEILQRD